MLLTKPLTTFLHSNRTSSLHTLLLTTPAGKILACSSPFPATVLRAQSTLACSLLTMYAPLAASGTMSAALPARQDEDMARYQQELDEDEDEEEEGNVSEAETAAGHADPEISSITIQLEHGTMVIRALQCSLLLIAIGSTGSSGPASVSASGSMSNANTLQATPTNFSPTLNQDLAYLSVGAKQAKASLNSMSPSTSPRAGSLLNGTGNAAETAAGAGHDRLKVQLHNAGHGGPASIAGSDVGSTNASTMGGGSIAGMKKRVEELAKWLDGELEGFSLSTAL